MLSFEDIRSHISAHYDVKTNDPFLMSIELPVSAQRQQSIFFAELESETEQKYLRISSPIAPLGNIDPIKCLEFNWEQRLGFFAVSDLDYILYLHLCENRPFDGLNGMELDFIIREMGALSDQLEEMICGSMDIV